jgi:ATP10 protein
MDHLDGALANSSRWTRASSAFALGTITSMASTSTRSIKQCFSDSKTRSNRPNMTALSGTHHLRQVLRQCAQCTSQRASWASSSNARQSFTRQIASSSRAAFSNPSQKRLREQSREDADDASKVQDSSSSNKLEEGTRGPSPEELSEFLSPSSRDSGLGKPLPFDSSTSAAADLADKQPLPYLSQPLGVPEPPTAMTGAKGNSLRGEADPNAFTEKRMQKRKLIVKEATRGYFHDFHAVRSHGGKTWRAPGTLIREGVGSDSHN